jgi:hypothetical protein
VGDIGWRARAQQGSACRSGVPEASITAARGRAPVAIFRKGPVSPVAALGEDDDPFVSRVLLRKPRKSRLAVALDRATVREFSDRGGAVRRRSR